MSQPTIRQHASLQSSRQIETLIKPLKPVLGLLYKTVCARFALLQQDYYDHQEQHEFCLQTAYIQFVRVFLVCLCVDYDLIPCHISDQLFARYKQPDIELPPGRNDSFLQLLEQAYQQICAFYPDFLNHQKRYDWFIPDEKTILALFALLERYDFRGFNVDVLGKVYNESFIEDNARSEKGQFYTPPEVVEYMLDSLAMPTYNHYDYTKSTNFLEKTIGDLSCGSGSFLVAAAARKSAILQRLVATHEVNSEQALQILTGTLRGFDLNPFACYLAEMNLLIQCLPFLYDKHAQAYRSIAHFQIHCVDVLEPNSVEQLNIRVDGFDYLLGNPPYVSAGEGADNLRYRDKVWNSGNYQWLHQRWDLFIAFFERNLQLLRPGTGKLGLIVSNSIETEGYAERLRDALISHYRLLQIDFFPGLRLFHDAAVENTIVLLEHCAPGAGHEVIRRKHLQADCKHFETLPPLPQLTSRGQAFRWRYDPTLGKSVIDGSIPLCAIVYIGTGIEAHSNEHRDPIIEGRRQKRFTLDDVFLPVRIGQIRPAEYMDEGVLGNDVEYYHLSRKRYVAYEKYRSDMRGARHIALFCTAEKLLLGETSGGYYDREGLFANHSVQVVVSWKALEQAGALEQKGIALVLRKSQQISGMSGNLAQIAALFDLRYLLGIINSRLMRQYIAANMHEGSRTGRVYPDVWKRLPIKVTSAERQQQIASLVDTVQEQYRQLSASPEEEQQVVQLSIDRLLSEIEVLVEAMFREPADIERLELINSRMAKAKTALG